MLGEVAGQTYRAIRDSLQTEHGLASLQVAQPDFLAPSRNGDEQETIEGGEAAAAIVFVPTAGFLGYMFKTSLENDGHTASAVVLELTPQMPSAEGYTNPPTQEKHISTAGTVALVAGPMMLTAGIIAACSLWRQRRA